jgi:hypothetical protein
MCTADRCFSLIVQELFQRADKTAESFDLRQMANAIYKHRQQGNDHVQFISACKKKLETTRVGSYDFRSFSVVPKIISRYESQYLVVSDGGLLVNSGSFII